MSPGHTVAVHDACCVVLAEALGCALAAADAHLAHATGPTSPIRVLTSVDP